MVHEDKSCRPLKDSSDTSPRSSSHSGGRNNNYNNKHLCRALPFTKHVSIDNPISFN